MNVTENIDPKLLKIIALAKGGFGGEKDTALRLVRQICKREGLDFDEVMSDGGDMPKEYEPDIKIRSKDELKICIQVAARFALTPEHQSINAGYYRGYREVWLKYTTTAARHIETLNAIDAYLRVYRIEKKHMVEALKLAFSNKHHLYPQFDTAGDDEPSKPLSDEERAKHWRAANIKEGLMESVKLTKQIGDGR